MPLENFITSMSACSSRPVSRRTSWILCARSPRETSSSVAKNSRFSRAARRGKNERSAATAMPTFRRTLPASRRASNPPTRTAPASGRSMVEINLRAVVFPLPFGPSSARTSAAAAENETSFKAMVSPRRSRPSQLNSAGRWRNILPTDSKTMRSMKADGNRACLHAQLLDFVVVILAVENRPFLGALDNGAALAFDFLPGSLVDAGFLHQQLFKNFAHFQADGVAVLDEVDFIQLRNRVGNHVGEFVDFIAAQSHGGRVLVISGFRLKNSLVFLDQLGFHLTEHFLVIGAALLHFLGISLKDDAHFIVNAVFERQFFLQSGVHLLVQHRHRLGLNETARDQFFGNFAGEIAHIFFRKEHDETSFLRKESLTHGSKK